MSDKYCGLLLTKIELQTCGKRRRKPKRRVNLAENFIYQLVFEIARGGAKGLGLKYISLNCLL